MKENADKHRFTLVELLVVIAVIAILAGLLLPAIQIVRKRAREAQAEAGVHSLLIAVTQYEEEYSYLPAPSSSQDYQLNTGDGSFLSALTGAGNRRGIQFLEPEADGGFNDPWDRPYFVALNANYDNIIESNFLPAWEDDNLQVSVAVWSEGADEDDGSDDIYSWD